METLFVEEDKPSLEVRKYASDFKWPIQYLDKHVYTLNTIVENDLELSTSHSNDSDSVYTCLFSPKDAFSTEVIEKGTHYYTTDVQFLTDTQQMIRSLHSFTPCCDVSCGEIQTQWTEVKHDPRFHSTYGYVEWEYLRPYNNSSWFMQCVSVSSMLAPVFSLIIPLLFLIFPFIILKMNFK